MVYWNNVGHGFAEIWVIIGWKEMCHGLFSNPKLNPCMEH